jgi:hypothetical protein
MAHSGIPSVACRILGICLESHFWCFVRLLIFGFVIPAQAGTQCHNLDSRLRGKDG